MTTLQRYHRLRHEYDHYQRRQQMLYSITLQKRDELDSLMNHINQLLLLEDKTIVDYLFNKIEQISFKSKSSICVYDHGDHLAMPSSISLEKYSSILTDDDDDEESDNDPLLQRLKLTKPSRLKTSSRQILNNNTTVHFTDSIILDEIHTIYDERLSE